MGAPFVASDTFVGLKIDAGEGGFVNNFLFAESKAINANGEQITRHIIPAKKQNGQKSSPFPNEQAVDDTESLKDYNSYGDNRSVVEIEDVEDDLQSNGEQNKKTTSDKTQEVKGENAENNDSTNTNEKKVEEKVDDKNTEKKEDVKE